jgi:hypothetical protein
MSKRTNPAYLWKNEILCDMIQKDNKHIPDDSGPIPVYGFGGDYHKYAYCSPHYRAFRYMDMDETETMGHMMWELIYWSHMMNKFHLVNDLTSDPERDVRLLYIYNNRVPARFSLSSEGENKIVKLLTDFIYVGVMEIPAMRFSKKMQKSYFGTQVVMICWNINKREFYLFDITGNQLYISTLAYMPFTTYTELNQMHKYYGYHLYCGNDAVNNLGKSQVLRVTEEPLKEASAQEVKVFKHSKADVSIQEHALVLEGKCIDQSALYWGRRKDDPKTSVVHVDESIQSNRQVQELDVSKKTSVPLIQIAQDAGGFHEMYKTNRVKYIRLQCS